MNVATVIGHTLKDIFGRLLNAILKLHNSVVSEFILFEPIEKEYKMSIRMYA